MRIKITVTTDQDEVLGQFTLDESDADARRQEVERWIGEQVLEQLPHGISYLIA